MKKKDEWRRKEVPDFCYATGWHEKRGIRSRTVVRKSKKKKGEWRRKEVPFKGRGTWSWTVELKKKKGQVKGA